MLHSKLSTKKWMASELVAAAGASAWPKEDVGDEKFQMKRGRETEMYAVQESRVFMGGLVASRCVSGSGRMNI